MGLEAFKSETKLVGEKEKFKKSKLCPCCGKEGEHIRNHQCRCTTDKEECDTLTWYHSDFTLNNATLHKLREQS